MFDLEHRKAQLEAIFEEQGWRGIAAIAKPLLIEKPEGGWDEAISLIVEAEYAQDLEKHNALINSLNESGLIDIVIVKEQTFIPLNQLKQLEQLILLKQEMHINIEGIESITYLLQRIQDMQQQIVALRNKLAFYTR